METGNLSTLPPWATELLERSRVAHLALLDDADHPRVLPVTFGLAAGSLWSAVDDKPKRVSGPELARVRFLRQCPQAALCVDHYDDDWSRLAWVQVLGTVDVIEVAAGRPGMDVLAAKYAPYRERPPEGPLLRLIPQRALCWRAHA